MTDFELITINRVVGLLRYESTKHPERNARDWLYKHKIKGFRRGLYVKEIIEKEMEKDIEKCYQLEDEVKKVSIPFVALSGLGTRQSRYQNKVQDLIQKQRQANTLAS